jgi:hypothetical protein
VRATVARIWKGKEMESSVEDRSPQQQTPAGEPPEGEQRWASLLEKVVNEQSSDPWHVKLGISLAWSAAIAVVAAIVGVLILGIRSLVSADLGFTFRNLSDHIFWIAALLMIAGMFSPSAGDLERARDRTKQQKRALSPEERRTRSVERRLRRVYDPWRWRIWGGAALTFGLAILSGLLAGPPA